MAETDPTKRYAIVTGANKGIGIAICRQLASKGIHVLLTARDQARGLEAVRVLNEEPGVTPGNISFHQLDVTDPSSVTALVGFVESRFGRLDILVNNAGVLGGVIDEQALRESRDGKQDIDWPKITTETSELMEECIAVNYYGVKRMVDAFVHLLRRSDSPRIVNVSSRSGLLQNVPAGWAKGVLSDAKSLSEEKVDEVVEKFQKDYRDGACHERNGWPTHLSAYCIAKAALNAYTMVLARKHLDFRVNCMCPGYVSSDMNHNTGSFTTDEGAEVAVMLALVPNGGPTGKFFKRTEEASLI
ncbi:hypothetical protein MLD38_004612 [Melastoma candidum]|uniref:Uncharacterized protein n=1 Tax=Melastoma candidum TaxID=119954 RepID=A0ACB9SAX4_9MYRT|nr:hypothetical protein MLD38_004612 [Melastoma candidum]